jgi:hypothetical protein
MHARFAGAAVVLFACLAGADWSLWGGVVNAIWLTGAGFILYGAIWTGAELREIRRAEAALGARRPSLVRTEPTRLSGGAGRGRAAERLSLEETKRSVVRRLIEAVLYLVTLMALSALIYFTQR